MYLIYILNLAYNISKPVENSTKIKEKELNNHLPFKYRLRKSK